MTMGYQQNAQSIQHYLNSVDPACEFASPSHGGYQHVAATLTDLVLQPHQKKYASQVTPAVTRLMTEYPQCATTSPFIAAMEETSPKYFLNFTDGQRARQIYALAQFFCEQGVETEVQLQAWIAQEENHRAFKQQRGISTRSVDYLRMLVGEETIPVDHSIRALLETLSVPLEPYDEAQVACMEAARSMNVSPRDWYLTCWKYWMAHRWPNP